MSNSFKITKGTLAIRTKRRKSFCAYSQAGFKLGLLIISVTFLLFACSKKSPASVSNTGSVSLTSDVAGMVLIDGEETGKRIKVQGVMLFEDIEIGMTEVAVKMNDGKMVKAEMVLVKAGETSEVHIGVPEPEAAKVTPEPRAEEVTQPAQITASVQTPAPAPAPVPPPPPAPPPPPKGDTSNPISLQANGSWVSQTMSPAEMWYVVRPSSNGTLTVETDGNLDTLIEIYDGNSLLKRDDDSGSGKNAKVEVNAVSGKNYRVKVWEYDRKTGGSYRIRASVSQIAIIDLKASEEIVHTITVNTKYLCRFKSADHAPTFILEIPSGYSAVKIYSEGSRSINGVVLNALGMAYYLASNADEAFKHILASNTSGGNFNFRVSADEKNVYILMMEADNRTGDFNLVIEGIR